MVCCAVQTYPAPRATPTSASQRHQDTRLLGGPPQPSGRPAGTRPQAVGEDQVRTQGHPHRGRQSGCSPRGLRRGHWRAG